MYRVAIRLGFAALLGLLAGWVLTDSVAQGQTAASTTITVSWVAPTQNTDASALTDLDHFTVYQGADMAHLVAVANIPAGTLTYLTPPLFAGTYYFALSASNKQGKESALTVAVPATIIQTPPPVLKTPNPPGAPRVKVN